MPKLRLLLWRGNFADQWGTCQGGTTAGTETCDGADNDCDGVTDEGCACDYSATSTGVCSGGTKSATDGNCQVPADYQSTETFCDGLDNDCDGTTDEGGVDLGSSVSATSACLTAGTGAQSAIVTTLVDQEGNPVTGANVTMTTTAGSLGVVQSSGNTYWAILTPPATSGVSGATVTVSVDDPCAGGTVDLSTTAQVAFADPYSGTGGGAAGCQADGNVRVKVIDASTGAALSGAHVMVGEAGNTAAFEDPYDPGADLTASNYGTTDANGYIEFHDFEAALDGPVTVTATYSGGVEYTYMTFDDIDASDFVLEVEEVYPATTTQVFNGDLSGITGTSNGSEAEFGLMLPDMQLETLLNFNLTALLAKNECYTAGSGFTSQDIAVPENSYIPPQDANYSFLTLTLSEKEYASAPVDYGERHLWGIVGAAPVSDATAGFVALLSSLDMQQIGVNKAVNVDGSAAARQDIAMDRTLSANVSCSIGNVPTDSDVFCLTMGDWDSGSDATKPTALGRSFLMGLGLDNAGNYSGAFSLDISPRRAPGCFTACTILAPSLLDDALHRLRTLALRLAHAVLPRDPPGEKSRLASTG